MLMPVEGHDYLPLDDWPEYDSNTHRLFVVNNKLELREIPEEERVVQPPPGLENIDPNLVAALAVALTSNVMITRDAIVDGITAAAKLVNPQINDTIVHDTVCQVVDKTYNIQS